ncbi:MAG: cell wall hydrolase [Muribaculaceae bacterium]|nr:cell wall hydrolase [Muribaculaceae bacterium]
MLLAIFATAMSIGTFCSAGDAPAGGPAQKQMLASVSSPATQPAETPDMPLPEPEAPAYGDTEAETMAKMLWGECRGCSRLQQAAAAWCALNRVDDPRWPNDVISVITQPCQFYGYDQGNPVTQELLDVANDVLARWELEKAGQYDSGRVLPKDYVFFTGDGVLNHFRTDFADTGSCWDWSLPSPYYD